MSLSSACADCSLAKAYDYSVPVVRLPVATRLSYWNAQYIRNYGPASRGSIEKQDLIKFYGSTKNIWKQELRPRASFFTGRRFAQRALANGRSRPRRDQMEIHLPDVELR
jgi:hypothetical protein